MPALSLWEPGRATYRTFLPWMPAIPKHQVEIPEYNEEKEKLMTGLFVYIKIYLWITENLKNTCL